MTAPRKVRQIDIWRADPWVLTNFPTAQILTIAEGREGDWRSVVSSITKRVHARIPESIDPDNKLQARGVAARYSVTVRTLDRWLDKPCLEFPQPCMVMRDALGRVCARFWRLGDLIDWERRQATPHAQVDATVDQSPSA